MLRNAVDDVALVSLLDKLRHDRVHPMLTTIGEQTLLWWADDDGSFRAYEAGGRRGSYV